MTAPPRPAGSGAATPAVALVVALAAERRAVARCLPTLRRAPWEEGGSILVGDCWGQRVALLQAGIGPARAGSAVLHAARHLSVSSVWSLGLAGGLDETLLAGDLICPEAVIRETGRVTERLPASPGGQAVRTALATGALPVRAGNLLTVQTPLRTPEAKRAAFRQTGALAVDMEAAGVADAAGQLEIPWLALKAVVDRATEPLPEFLDRLTTLQGNLDWRGLLGSLLAAKRRRILWRLERSAAHATASLRRALPLALRAWRA